MAVARRTILSIVLLQYKTLKLAEEIILDILSMAENWQYFTFIRVVSKFCHQNQYFKFIWLNLERSSWHHIPKFLELPWKEIWPEIWPFELDYWASNFYKAVSQHKAPNCHVQGSNYSPVFDSSIMPIFTFVLCLQNRNMYFKSVRLDALQTSNDYISSISIRF